MMNGEYRRNGRVIVRRGLALSLGLWLALLVGALPRPALAAFDSQVASTISVFYAAAFNRTPVPNSALPNYGDLGGLAFWTDAYLAGEGDLAQYNINVNPDAVYAIADYFVASPEFQARYPAELSSEGYVLALYQNLLGRAPDDDGLAFWVGELDGGASRGKVLADFTNSPEAQDFNPTQQAAMQSFITLLAENDGVVTTEQAKEWVATNPQYDAAVFDNGFLTLIVTRTTGTGEGTVESEPAGINCGSDCTANFAPGSTVTLTATPVSDSNFAGWDTGQEDECSAAESCTVTMSGPRNVTATFAANIQLTVTRTGTGEGTVESEPAGINCGSDDDCTANFAPGSTVTLTATPVSDSNFDGWDTGQEDECSAAESCTVTMSEPRNVTAAFAANIPLTVTKAGTGEGAVTSIPAGINCGNACIDKFAPNSTVTLTATPASGSTFTGWSGGDCSGTAPCSITLSQARLVTATFDRAAIVGTVTFDPSSNSEYPRPRAITITAKDQSGTRIRDASIRFAATSHHDAAPQLSCTEPALVDWLNDVKVLVDQSLTLHAIACIDNVEIAKAEPASYTVANRSYFNDTGYDLCADRGRNRSCSDPWIADFPGFPGQDGNYGRDAWARTGDSADPADPPDPADREYALAKIGSGDAGFDFTRICADGEARGEEPCPSNNSDSNNSLDWACVRDNVTRLTWAVGGTADPNRRRTWFQANSDAAAFNSCGYTDWRLPTVRELHSIIHYGRRSPNLVAPDYFPEILSFFWTQTPQVNDPSMRWAIATDAGVVFWTPASEFVMRAFFVRGDADPSPLSDTPQFTIHPRHDGVAIQDGAGLMWMRCKVGKLWDNGFCADFEYAAYNWTDALKKVQDINHRDDVRVNFGYRDWRLPNVKELGGITDLRRFDPAVDTTVFPNLVAGPQPENARFWTATPEFRDGGISVYMNSGLIGFDSRSRSLAILLVRNIVGEGEALNTHLPPPPGNDP